ncbi:MAG: hypothetical protein JWM33_597 [Caulobacteraceae bacterium]|nr:hypothetical protein [Caulobacteraceae bacterium]
MFRPLLIVFTVGAVLALGCGITYGAMHDYSRDRPSPAKAGAVETRDFAWTGGPSLKIGFPAEVTYIQGPASRMVATGSKETLDKMKVGNGEIDLDINCLSWSFIRFSFSRSDSSSDENTLCGRDQAPLRITITAPSTQAFDASGVAHLDIQNYSQPELKLTVSGASTIKAAGKAGKLDLDVSGASHAELADLALTDAKADASGASHATLKATGRVEAKASGASSLNLLTRPANLDRSVSGASHIDLP